MKIIKLSVALAFAFAASLGHAAVPAAQANRLGVDLTPIGAEKAGNIYRNDRCQNRRKLK